MKKNNIALSWITILIFFLLLTMILAHSSYIKFKKENHNYNNLLEKVEELK